MGKTELTLVIPVYNEQESIIPLHKKLVTVLDKLGKPYEILFVNDGSTDKTSLAIKSLKDARVREIKFRRNYGQTAAMDAGFKAAAGKTIVSLDGDLQNDPADIPRLLAKLDQGWDVVCGWRKNRKDPLSKKIFSRFANMLRFIVLRDRIHDSGCSLKAYRKECFNDVDLYGEMHRFIPAILRWRGFRVTEIIVTHHARQYGKTKYTMKRVLKGFLDMLVVKFWMQYAHRPIHLFGTMGVLTFGLGFLISFYLTCLKLFFGASLSNRPLLLLGVLLIILGTQFIFFGLLADMLMKIYFRGKPNYTIKEGR